MSKIQQIIKKKFGLDLTEYQIELIRGFTDEEKKRSVLLDPEVYDIAKALAVIEGRTLKGFLEQMVLDKEKRQKKT